MVLVGETHCLINLRSCPTCLYLKDPLLYHFCTLQHQALCSTSLTVLTLPAFHSGSDESCGISPSWWSLFSVVFLAIFSHPGHQVPDLHGGNPPFQFWYGYPVIADHLGCSLAPVPWVHYQFWQNLHFSFPTHSVPWFPNSLYYGGHATPEGRIIPLPSLSQPASSLRGWCSCQAVLVNNKAN